VSGFYCQQGVFCMCAFDTGAELRFHHVRFHGVHAQPDNDREWPEFSATELTRLRWFRWSRLEGWSFAMEEVSSSDHPVAQTRPQSSVGPFGSGWSMP
jgi:hypothetical protein